jgi:mono/diheme cytochrome c family protein
MPYTVFMNFIALVLVALALAPAAAEVNNPVPASAGSVASGGKIFARYCASCHGKEGAGDGLGGAKLDPKPSNLTDADWKHGAADGEIFQVIHDGAKDTGMKAFGSRITDHEIWDVVNYIRSLKQAQGSLRPEP